MASPATSPKGRAVPTAAEKPAEKSQYRSWPRLEPAFDVHSTKVVDVPPPASCGGTRYVCEEARACQRLARIAAQGVPFIVGYHPNTYRETRTIPMPDPNSPQVITTAPTEKEAALIVNHLATLGIQADI